MHAQVAQHALDGMVAQITVAAVKLQTAIDHVEAHIGGQSFCHGSETGSRRLAAVERCRRAMQHEPRRLDLGRVIRDAETERLEVRKPSAELLSLLHVGHGAVEAELRTTEGTSRDVEPPAIETAHRDLETLPFGSDSVGNRDMPLAPLSPVLAITR